MSMPELCLNLSCFANHHGQCVGDKDYAIRMNQCDKEDDYVHEL